MPTDRLVITSHDDDNDENSDDDDEQVTTSEQPDTSANVIDFNMIDKDVNEQRRLERKADKKKVPLKRRVKQSAKLEHDLVCMVRPNPIADRDRERRLSRIATLGVVKLFNVVAERRKQIEERLEGDDKLIDLRRKKDKTAGLAPNEFNRRLSGYRQKYETKHELDEEEQDNNTSTMIGRKKPKKDKNGHDDRRKKRKVDDNNGDVKEEILSD